MKRLHVAVAVLRNSSNEYLISQRLPGTHMGGLWEFPGGKLEPGESAFQALQRELYEEVGLTIRQADPLIRVEHDYPAKQVLLDTWLVTDWTGEASGREGQRVAWVGGDQLPAFQFPQANLAIVQAATLPRLYPILDAAPSEVLLQRLQNYINAGYSMVQLRAKTLPEGAFETLARQAIALCRASGVHLLLNADWNTARRLDADGVHLSSRQLMAIDALPADDFLVGASCHDARELARATQIGASFAVLSPVLKTTSHPGQAPLGWEAFEGLLNTAKLPVYALGGLNQSDLERAKHSGAQGLAGISMFESG